VREPPLPPFFVDGMAYQVFRTMRALGREFGRQAQSAGLTRSWGMILGHLAHHPAGMTASELRQGLGVTAASISRTLREMERHGLVTRTPHPEDARAMLIHFTATSREMLSAFPMIVAAIETRAFAGFSCAELDSLRAVLERIRANLGDSSEPTDCEIEVTTEETHLG
jgi:MarR family transcriptional regulator for hemolysin